MPDRNPTLDDILAAQKTLHSVSRVTPVHTSQWLTGCLGGPALLKCENLQRTGSYKLRGAYNRIAGLTEEERARGVVAASAGNHAQGVALAGTLLGANPTVFMPVGAPLPKVEASRSYGADVRFHGVTVEEALVAAEEFAAESGAVFIHPFDHPLVVAGQGTVALEILEQCPQARTIVAGVGGGGLLAGLATAVRALRPEVRVVGVQAEGAAPYPPSLAAGYPVTLDSVATMADGISVRRPGDVPFSIIRELADEVRTVSEESISRALVLLLERAKLTVEPAGAAAVAALLDNPGDFEPPVVAVLSGGNIDPLLLVRVLRHGLVSAGRYLSLRVQVPDRPGALAELLALLTPVGANIHSVEHVRTNPELRVGEAEVALQLETRGAAHRDEVIARLRAAGYRLAWG